MKNLFERFEKQSQDLEKILEKSIGLVRERKNLNEDLCKEIGSALKGLRSVYDEITMKLPEKAGGATVPDGASVREIEVMWQESVSAQQGALKEVLSEFIRVYSDDAKYQEAIEEQLTLANNLLIVLEKEEKADPDVSSYARFLEYVKADLDKDEELADKLDDEGIEGFSDRVIKGLRRKKYSIREEDEAGKEPAAELESVEEEHIERKPVSADAEKKADDNVASSPVEVGEESAASEESEEPVEYLHPKRPIVASKVPSEHKFDDLLRKTDRLFGFLYDNLTFIGLLDKERAIAHMDNLDILNADRSRELLDYLESKGYICSYEYDGKEILCATELLHDCFAKKSFQSLIKRRFGFKETKNCILCGNQDFDKNLFEQHFRLATQYVDFIDKLNEDEIQAAILPQARWDSKVGRYYIICPANPNGNKKEMEFLLLSPEEMMNWEAKPGDMMICYSPEPPKLDKIADSVGYVCLTDDGLFMVWNGKWTRFDDVKPGGDESIEGSDEDFDTSDLEELDVDDFDLDDDEPEEETNLTEEDFDAALTDLSSSDAGPEEKPEKPEAAADQPDAKLKPEAQPAEKKIKTSVAKTDSKVETAPAEDKPVEIPPALSVSEQHAVKAKGAFAVNRFDCYTVAGRHFALFCCG